MRSWIFFLLEKARVLLDSKLSGLITFTARICILYFCPLALSLKLVSHNTNLADERVRSDGDLVLISLRCITLRREVISDFSRGAQNFKFTPDFLVTFFASYFYVVVNLTIGNRRKNVSFTQQIFLNDLFSSSIYFPTSFSPTKLPPDPSNDVLASLPWAETVITVVNSKRPSLQLGRGSSWAHVK